MMEAFGQAVAALSNRVQRLETLPFNPYSPDAEMFDHFAGDGTLDARWTATLVNTGTVTIPNATPTIVRLATGATAASNAQLDWGVNYSLVGLAKWLDVRGRFAVTTAVDADDTMIMYLQTALPDIVQIGVRGATSPTFFQCRSSSGGLGNFTSTTTVVPIDTAYHDFRIQTMPDRILFYIDNDLVAEHTTNVPTAAAMQPRLQCSNGASGSRVMDCDLLWVRESR